MESPELVRNQPHLKPFYFVRIAILAAILFFTGYSTTFYYSILPDMIVSLGMTTNKSVVGKYAIWLSCGPIAGRTIAAPFWGFFIDSYGRKKGLMIMFVLVCGLEIVFGLVNNFYEAVVINLLIGLAHGFTVVGRTLQLEIVPKVMRPWSYSISSTGWALGQTIGPFIGSLSYGYNQTYPYLYSTIIVAATGVCIAIVSYIFFDETMQNETQDEKEKIIEMEMRHEIARIDFGIRLTENEQSSETIQLIQKFPSLSKRDQIKYILGLPNIWKLAIIYSFTTFFAQGVENLIPIWTAGKYQDGGLGFNYNEISEVFLYLSIPQMIIQIFLYPFLQKRVTDFTILATGYFIHLIVFIAMPFARLLPIDNATLQITWISACFFIKNLGMFMAYATVLKFSNESVFHDKRGKVNALQVMMSSIFQTFAPILVGETLAWSMSNGLSFPFDYRFIFIILDILVIVTLFVIYSLKFHDTEKIRIKGEIS